MDLRDLLIESKKDKTRGGGWKSILMSVMVHGALLALIVVLSMTSTRRAEADETAIPVYMSEAAAPPPPPPPPPPPAASNSAPVQPKVQPKIQPVEVPQESFVQPKETPKEVPVVDPFPTNAPVSDAPVASSAPTGGVTGGVEGGVVGGQIGGVQGGTLGGQVGGQIGGVLGGTPGGVVGGTPGGTGTAPASVPSGPMRVGGDVKAPGLNRRVEPVYTEVARKARIQGVVILEAIIDKHGNVDRVKVIRGLPMGLTESAVSAVKQWKFRPGTYGGRNVDVIFNLTVNFRLGADGPTVSKNSSRPASRPEPEPAPAVEERQPEPEPQPLPEAPAPQEPAQEPQGEPLPTSPE